MDGLEETYAAAARDLERIKAGEAPTEADLAAAPSLHGWWPVTVQSNGKPAIILAGIVTGHPRLHNGPATTSLVVALDPRGRWARTFSRWYRLGERADER